MHPGRPASSALAASPSNHIIVYRSNIAAADDAAACTEAMKKRGAKYLQEYRLQRRNAADVTMYQDVRVRIGLLPMMLPSLTE